MNLLKSPANERSSISRRCVIVAGMHRSGTSAITRVVNFLGADIASTLLPATPGDNDYGYWESAAVVEIHDQLLRALGSAFDDPFPLPERWLDSSFARDAQHRLAQEIRKDFDGSRFFVVKDPRITRLLQLWLDLLEKLAIEPVVVIPVRNPLEVAASLGRREQYSVPSAQSLLLYVRSYLDAELASRGRQRLFVRYEQLLIDWRHFATALAITVGAPLQPLTAEKAAAIDEFLTRDLYHNRASREELARAPGIAATVVEMFDLLTEAAKTGDETSLRRSFDRLRETTSEATRLFQGVVLSDRDRAQRQLGRLRHDHSESELRVSELAAAHSASEARVAVLTAALTAERAKSAALHGELATTKDRLRERESALTARSAELLAARGDAALLRADLAARSVEVEHLNARLAIMQNFARRLEKDLATVSKERDAITQSTIWRMTAPLRFAGASFPRLVRPWLKLQRESATSLPGTAQPDRDRVAMSAEADPGGFAFHPRDDKATIALSGLFDESWYKENYPDVAAAGVDPIEHYLSCGAVEGRNPGPLFNTLAYVSSNPDACAEGQNPLLHYIRARTRAGATEPVGPLDEGYVFTLPHSTVGRLVSSFSRRSNEEEVAVIGVAVAQWNKNYPRI
jgi:hypothetical protein